jgi:hypothetical protein
MSVIARRIAICQHPNGEGVWWDVHDEAEPTCIQDCDCKPVVYVRADTTQGAVDSIRAARDAARTPGDVKTVRAILNEALDRFDRHPYEAVPAKDEALVESSLVPADQLRGAVSREHAVQAIGWLSAEVAVHGAPSLGPEWLELWDRALTASVGQQL